MMELTSQRLVVTHDEGRDVEVLDDVGHGKRFAASCHAKHDASFLSIFQLGNQFLNCLWLVPGGLEFCVKFEAFDRGIQFLQNGALKGLGEIKRVAL